jgi:hypothetical protein
MSFHWRVFMKKVFFHSLLITAGTGMEEVSLAIDKYNLLNHG